MTEQTRETEANIYGMIALDIIVDKLDGQRSIVWPWYEDRTADWSARFDILGEGWTLTVAPRDWLQRTGEDIHAGETGADAIMLAGAA